MKDAARRGSVVTLYGRRTNTSDRLASGSLATSGGSPRRPAASRVLANSTGRSHSRIPISSVATKKNTSTSGCCDRRGWLGRSPRSTGRLATVGQRRAVGATVVASGHHSRAGVNPSIGPAFVPGTGLSGHHARLDRRTGYCRQRVRPAVAVAPLCGLFDTSGHARACRRVRAHSGGRITPGCTRRRRANIFPIQPVANGCRLWDESGASAHPALSGCSASFTTG